MKNMKRWFTCLLVIFFLISVQFTTTSPVYAAPDPKVLLDEKLRTPRFIAEKWKNPHLKNKQEMVWAFLQSQKHLFQFTDHANVHFQMLKEESDSLGFTHYRMQQIHNGIPVYGADQTIHLNKQNQIESYFGKFIPKLEQKALPKKAKISSQQAQKIVEKDLKFQQMIHSPRVKLWIYPYQDQYYLAYEVKVSTVEPKPGYWHYYIDAISGKVIHKFNAIHQIQGNGKGVFGDQKTFEVTCNDGRQSCFLHDQTRGKGIKTHDAQNKENTSSLPGPLISSSTTTFEEPAGVDAHKYLETTYDYFKKTFGRNSYDNKGATIVSSVHVGENWNNAAWNGKQILFGDGDGKTFTTLSAALDVAAHELTHAITENTAGLQYYNESGALNESISDIFAVMVDSDDWLIGEEIYTPNQPGDALRSMKDPTQFNQPDHYRDRYTGWQDNGGVHINSGINNKAAYLLMDGGTHDGVTVQKIGKKKTAEIYYRALTHYLTSTSRFQDMRQAAIQSAQDLFGANSSEVTSVQKAYDAIGVK